jgi:hypothetical protein
MLADDNKGKPSGLSEAPAATEGSSPAGSPGINDRKVLL